MTVRRPYDKFITALLLSHGFCATAELLAISWYIFSVQLVFCRHICAEKDTRLYALLQSVPFRDRFASALCVVLYCEVADVFIWHSAFQRCPFVRLR